MPQPNADLFAEKTTPLEQALLLRGAQDRLALRGAERQLAVEHVLGMMAAGDSIEDLLAGYEWLERDDILACLEYARRMVGHERLDISISLKPGKAA